MSRNRSASNITQSPVDIKSWQQRLPTVEEARPSRCLVCDAASRPVGGPLQMHGHGTRERQVRGPDAPDGTPTMVTIQVRRYRCIMCHAVITVVPREVRARRLYSASAIGLALALWGLLQAAAVEVRRQINPAKITGPAAAAGWATLGRWARAVRQGDLFAGTPRPAADATLRQIAASAAAASAASAEPTTRGLPLTHRAFFGAGQAA